MMDIIDSLDEMQRRAQSERSAGRALVLVPTMGYLHEGHLTLLRAGRQRGDLLILSIFVNPTQFGEGEDFADYPRDLQRDSELAREVGVDVIFAPSAAAMYPSGYATYVDVEGITEILCGASRPGHFRGVTTVVAKLFNIIQPQTALFGSKDFQQLTVIRRMVNDLNMPIEIVGMPIHREADGLAMSSRNVYLSVDQRRQALVLSQALQQARSMVTAGEQSCAVLVAAAREMINAQPEARIDYVSIRHGDTLEEQRSVDDNSVMLLAVFIGATRLIDNLRLREPT